MVGERIKSSLGFREHRYSSAANITLGRRVILSLAAQEYLIRH
jgi:hypothetical protein